MKKTHEQFIKELKEINPNIEILSKYTSNSEKVLCRCTLDFNEWKTTPHVLLQGHGCPICADKHQNRRNNEDFIKELKERHPNIIPLEKFKNAGSTMRLKCSICGYEWQTSPNVLLNKNGYGCPKCANHGRVSEREMIERLKKSNPTIRYISGYKGLMPHANFECLRCGNKWSTPPNSVLHGRGCPVCKLSHGELEVSKILDKLNIKYERQYKFPDCKDVRSLPFDFYIKSYNVCIEYDGVQHFMPIRFGKHETEEQLNEKFKLQQKRDKIKNDYCKNNNINLIRIPYTELKNIETILNKYFLKQIRKRIYGVAGKIGNLDMKGEIHTYQDMNNQSEKVHLMLKDFTYGFMLTNIENFAKVTLQ